MQRPYLPATRPGEQESQPPLHIPEDPTAFGLWLLATVSDASATEEAIARIDGDLPNLRMLMVAAIDWAVAYPHLSNKMHRFLRRLIGEVISRCRGINWVHETRCLTEIANSLYGKETERLRRSASLRRIR